MDVNAFRNFPRRHPTKFTYMGLILYKQRLSSQSRGKLCTLDFIPYIFIVQNFWGRFQFFTFLVKKVEQPNNSAPAETKQQCLIISWEVMPHLNVYIPRVHTKSQSVYATATCKFPIKGPKTTADHQLTYLLCLLLHGNRPFCTGLH